jgi:hypothetical protein
MDDRLRALGRAARAEVEAGLDVDAELQALAGRRSSEPATPRTVEPARRPGATVWVAAAAAAAVAFVGGILLLGNDDDTALQIADPETTIVTGVATTVASAPTSTLAPTESTVTPSTGVAVDPSPAACAGASPDEAEVESIARSIVAARSDGTPPSVAGCLESIPDAFDGSPSRCWACPGLTFADRPVVVGESDGAFDFQLAVSTPDGDTLVDTVETWRFERDDDLLVFAGVEFAEPLVSRADSLATITAYFDAVESGDWIAAARMLDDGAQNAEERADLQRLDLDDYSYESVAAALEQWCGAGCWTERPAAADLEFDGFSHRLVRFGESIRVRWYEGMLSIDGLPPRLPDGPAVEVPVVDWRDLTWEGSGIEGSCVPGELTCTQLVHAADGTPVTYEPTTRVLTRHSTPEVTVTLPESYGDAGYVLHAGPDDVAYLQVAPAAPAELAADVVAVTLAPDDRGREIGRWADVANNVGDSELVPTLEGLANVNCCGPDATRPDPQGEVLVPWLDRSGEQVTSDAPTIRVEVAHPDLTVHRTDPLTGATRSWTYQPGGDWMPRGMPRIVPTFDGGFIAAESGGTGTSIARGYVGGPAEQIVLDDSVLFVDSIDPAGRFLLGDGSELDGWFVRIEPFADRTQRPADPATIDFETGTVTLPDLSGITADWLFDPVAFGAAVRGPLAVNEQRTIDASRQSESGWVVTITTSNFFDDSVAADRWDLTLEQSEDGRLAFVSGTWANSCQPGRGPQNFSTELCA